MNADEHRAFMRQTSELESTLSTLSATVQAISFANHTPPSLHDSLVNVALETIETIRGQFVTIEETIHDLGKNEH